MGKVTVIIHSHHSKQINDCVKSAKILTDNILIIGQENITEARIIPYPNSGIVETAREYGISQAQTEWIFLLDADERMTPSLAAEINSVINQSSHQDSYFKIPRKEIIFGKNWLRHGGWWPNYQIRLIKKASFVSWPKSIHSTPVIKGELKLLKNPLLHYSQNDIAEIVDRTVLFEDKESDLLYQAGRPASTPVFFRKFMGELWRRLFMKAGFLDGEVGIIESIYQAFSKTITYIFLYEKQNRSPL